MSYGPFSHKSALHGLFPHKNVPCGLFPHKNMSCGLFPHKNGHQPYSSHKTAGGDGKCPELSGCGWVLGQTLKGKS